MANCDYSPIEPLPGMVQEVIKSKLVEAFVSQKIVTTIKVDWQGRIEIKVKS
jgi:hypothetical protein